MIDKNEILRALDEFITKAEKRLSEAMAANDYGDVNHISGFKGGLEMARTIVALAREK